MEDDIIVVTILGVGDKVLHSFGSGFREEADCDIAICRVNGGRCSRCRGFGFLLLFSVDVAGFFVLDVSFGFGHAESVS